MSSLQVTPSNNNNNHTHSSNPVARQKLIACLKEAARKVLQVPDPWEQYGIPKIPAERVIRHLYHPSSKTWSEEETLVKMQAEPFTRGAMRVCYRLKKRATPPQSSTNHHFHALGWNQACTNYIAKAYHTPQGDVDCSAEAKEAVQKDVALQYEASHWAERFNQEHPPKSIVFIRAYALEFPDRPGKPWFAVERFISGKDVFGAGFTKHNTNSGFVDEALHRVTPQTFSAFSFYDSQGERLVADIQGVGDLYTDPQVLSSDYRFGDGDLGPRGMALFFHSFRHNSLADSMGIPVFALSKNELRHQHKYPDDEEFSYNTKSQDSSKEMEEEEEDCPLAAMDLHRMHRSSLLLVPPETILPDELQKTERRSNTSKVRQAIADSLRISSRPRSSNHFTKLSRTNSDMDEVAACLELAKEDFRFDPKVYHRKASGELLHTSKNKHRRRPSLLARQVSDPMPISVQTRANLGKVHYQLAVLHGMGRFPEIVPPSSSSSLDEITEDTPPHDAFSVLYHLAHAASLHCVAACLALGRLHAGLETCVSSLLQKIVPVDFETSKDLLRRAMESPFPPAAPKAAAGCLLYQVYLDELQSDPSLEEDDEEEEDSLENGTPTSKPSKPSPATIMQLIQDILQLLETSKEEQAALRHHRQQTEQRRQQQQFFHPGDRAEGNYCLEGSFYPGTIESVSEDGKIITIRYDDDDSTEDLTKEHVRLFLPPNATQTLLGGPLSDAQTTDAFDDESSGDETFLVEVYELKAELAELKAQAGDKDAARQYYSEASEEAMAAHKLKLATQWSLLAES
eukprot:CAMPEP_0176011026 /NCGR_PEP_ID=MMETSP0120_2-20121206/5075_1 /TAXON_ID=160619 /ORGANISM="Kryptoperidinium foliaceum, Strain CCMP 1326" /LENGTH=796 /DNA_ID=CAMNT_0017343883 /DNA_START=142 /DNA_END=2529 /DNA_ORIENTATION=-